jgi:hypothetical protein
MRKTSLSLDKRFGAWAGSRQDLLALSRLMEAQFEEERAEIHRRHDERLQSLDREEAYLSSTGVVSEERAEMLKDARRSADESRTRDLDGLRVELSITDNENEQTRDYLDELIDEYDFRFASRVGISCNSWTPISRRCSIDVSNGPFGRVTLTVSGDTPWVRAAFGALEKELRKRRPWWSFVRHESLLYVVPFAIAASISLALAGLVAITPLKGPINDFLVPGAVVLFALLVFASMPATDWLMTRLIPNFEIRDPDVPSARKKLSRLVSLGVGGFLILVAILQGIAWILDQLQS